MSNGDSQMVSLCLVDGGFASGGFATNGATRSKF